MLCPPAQYCLKVMLPQLYVLFTCCRCTVELEIVVGCRTVERQSDCCQVRFSWETPDEQYFPTGGSVVKQSISLAFTIILSKHDLLGSITSWQAPLPQKCWEIFPVKSCCYNWQFVGETSAGETWETWQDWWRDLNSPGLGKNTKITLQSIWRWSGENDWRWPCVQLPPSLPPSLPRQAIPGCGWCCQEQHFSWIFFNLFCLF